MLTRAVIVALLWTASASLAPAPPPLPPSAERAIEHITIGELRRHVEQLASDAFAGRGLGQPGNRLAEQYIVDALAQARVTPAGSDYRQPVKVYLPALGRDGALTVTRGDGTAVLTLAAGREFSALPPSADREVTAPLRFAGHGLSGQGRHDDYAGVNAHGAVVLVLEGAPAWMQESLSLTPAQKQDLQSLDRKIADARAHGAVGLLVIREYLGNVRSEWPPARQRMYRRYEEESPLVVAAMAAGAAGPLRHALERRETLTVRLTPGVVIEPLTAHNVLGMIEGRDPSAGMVVVGAHLDHDGVDEVGQIYNGADDNASGTAAVIAMASAFERAAAEGVRPARAVVFALWNGEEQGSLGAEGFLAAPVPNRRIVASINLDMVGRAEDIVAGDPRFYGFARTTAGRSANVLHLLGYSHSPDLARIVDRANASVRLTIKEEYDRGAQNLLQRSDHWPFLKRGVPAIFLTTGLHPDYHTPADDTDRIDFPKLERITELAGRAAWLVADGEAPRFRGK